ncbi:hypothetical protein [Tautonia plasticadhaerens]|uniref:PEGA domain protein n=1 Tax=Tautonia plasticadhaerens TaxID=2527974 RepID=A0A518H514_9BACT|nr:hypothetical protein [Tautonia plasticadhaerens]QDV35923.1 hypothetical protein ElP_38320 [Tautonia plasticadhaerens]
MVTLGMFAALMPPSLVVWASRAAGGGALGVVVLGFVAEHSGPRTGEVVVHVTEPGVELSVGGISLDVRERRYEPLVFELPAGRHELTMSRGGRLLHREWFSIEGGDSVVLAAWDQEGQPHPAAAASPPP